MAQKTYEELIKEELNLPDDNEEEDVTPARSQRTEVETEEDVEVEEVEDELEDDEEESDEEEDLTKTYTSDEVSKITKSRLKSYDKKVEKLQKYKKAMDSLGDVTGLDPDELASKLLDMTVEEQAKLLNIPVEQVRQTVNQRKQARLTKKEKTDMERQLKYLDLVSKPGFEDLTVLREDIEELMDSNPDLSYEQAFILTKSEIDKKTPKAKPTTKNQRVVSAPSVGTTRKTTIKVSPAIRDAANRAGMDVKEYVAYSKMKNIDDYYAYNKK